jgi:hypothetical protein
VPELGNSGKPGSGWEAYGGSSYPSIEVEQLTAPRRLRILSVGVWAGGWSGSCRARLGIWSAAGALLGQSAEVSFANEGAGGPAGSNVARYVAALAVPVELDAGVNFYVGFNRHPNDAHQVSKGASGSGPHFHDEVGPASWPTPPITAPVSVDRRIGAYVADYLELAGAWVRRGGSWVLAGELLVRRGGVWVPADTVAVRRGAAWVDAQ